MNFELAKSLNIYETFSPLYKVLKLFGMMPFEMNLKNGKVSLKYHDLLWMFTTWMFWTSLIAWNIRLGAREPGEVSEIILSGWHWLLIFELFSFFIIQLVNFVRRKKIGELFAILNEVDEMNTLMPFKEDFSATKEYTLKVIVGSISLNILIHIFNDIAMYLNYNGEYSFDTLLMSSYFYITLLFSLIYQQFLFATSNVKSRFNLINKNLRSFFASHHRPLAYVEPPPQNSHESSQTSFIRKVAIMHDKLNDAVEIINYSFSYELLPGMVVTALSTIFSSFCVFRLIYDQSLTGFIPSVVNIVWTCYHLVFLIAAIFMADSTSNSANDTGKILSRIMNNTNNDALLNKISVFMQQIKHRPTMLSCGLFVIDWTLAFSMISAATTYLFIILQFEMSKESVEK